MATTQLLAQIITVVVNIPIAAQAVIAAQVAAAIMTHANILVVAVAANAKPAILALTSVIM
jgi:hypothetical protein